MDFQHLASVETHALVDTLLQEHTAASLRHIRILREALDTAAREISAPGDPGPLLAALTDRLTAAAGHEVDRVRQDAAAALEALEARLDEERARSARLASAVETADGETARLGAEVARLEHESQAALSMAAQAEDRAAARAAEAAAERQEQAARIEQLTSALANADERATVLTAALEAEHARADGAERDARDRASAAATEDATRRAEIGRLDAALADAERRAATLSDEAQAARARAEALDQDLAVTIEAHAEVEAALKQAQGEIRQASHARATAEVELADARVALERAEAETGQLREQVERQAATLTALEQRLAEALDAGAERDALSAELEARRARIDALEGAAAEREAHARDLEAKLQDAAQAEAQLLDDLATRELALEREQADARGARAELDALSTDHATAVARMQALERDLAAAIEASHDRKTIAARLHDSAARIDALEAELADTSRSARDDAEGLRHDVERMVALFDVSARALTDMAHVASSADLLTDLVKRLALQFSRVVLFRVKGDQLMGEQQAGFDMLDLASLTLPTSGDSLAARAFRSGTAEHVTGADASAAGLPSGGAPTLAVTLPIVLHGVPIAIVYADDGDMPESVRGPALHPTSLAFAQLLVGQVVALLVRHTHELKTMAELRDYAGTLLQEARAMYDADVAAGTPVDELRSRLKENLDCASQLYTYRAAMEGTAAAVLLDEQIAEAGAGDSAFARDLRGVMEACESLILNP